VKAFTYSVCHDRRDARQCKIDDGVRITGDHESNGRELMSAEAAR
jgi:hypothetical protein